MPPRDRTRYTRHELADAVARSNSIAEVLRHIGLVPCGGNYENIRRRAREWNIDTSHLERRIRRSRDRYRFAEQPLRAALQGARSRAAVLRRLGLEPTPAAYRALAAACRRYQIDLSRLPGRSWARGQLVGSRRRPLRDVLVAGVDVSTPDLRRRLIQEGLKEPRCERCGQDVWEGRPIPLELNHRNGHRRDNRLENLELLCPNCHALTPTYRGRNIGRVSTSTGHEESACA